jgi:hypothetical protein
VKNNAYLVLWIGFSEFWNDGITFGGASRHPTDLRKSCLIQSLLVFSLRPLRSLWPKESAANCYILEILLDF